MYTLPLSFLFSVSAVVYWMVEILSLSDSDAFTVFPSEKRQLLSLSDATDVDFFLNPDVPFPRLLSSRCTLHLPVQPTTTGTRRVIPPLNLPVRDSRALSSCQVRMPLLHLWLHVLPSLSNLKPWSRLSRVCVCFHQMDTVEIRGAAVVPVWASRATTAACWAEETRRTAPPKAPPTVGFTLTTDWWAQLSVTWLSECPTVK